MSPSSVLPDAGPAAQPESWAAPAPPDAGPPPAFRLGRRPELDGVRGVAVLTIMAYHTSLNRYLRGGFLGVDLFLVLSGFLITCLLVEEHVRHGSIRLRLFYARRILRLFPALWVLLGACVLLALYSDIPRSAGIPTNTILHGVLLVLCCAGNWAWVFPVDMLLLGHTWSLGLEEQFYLLWPPLLALLLRRRVRRRWLALLVVAGILSAAVLRAALFRGPNTLSYHYTTTGLATRADSLLAGCLVGLLACWNCLPRRGPGHRALQVAGFVSVVLLIYLGRHVRLGSPCLYTYGVFTLAAAAAAVFLAAVVSDPPRLVSRLLGAVPLAGMGRIAYGLYLWHYPVFWLFNHYLSRAEPSSRPGPLFGFALRCAVTLAAALLSFYCVERPFLSWKSRLARA
jgi:peptidoglycan/LPS O-acetylase OafA/YrhL